MALIAWGNQFKRTDAQSLTADEIFSTHAELTTYLSDPLCYSGQTASVTSDADDKKNGLYWIVGTAGSFSAVKLSTAGDVADAATSVFHWKGNVNSATLVKSGTSVKPGYAYRWNETLTTPVATTLPAENSVSGSDEVLERGDLLICAEVENNVPKYAVVQNNIDISDITQQLNDLGSQVTGLGTRIGALEDDIDTLSGSITQINSNVSSIEGRVDDVEADVAEHGTAIEGLSSDLSEAQTQILGLSDSVDALETTTIPGIHNSVTEHGTDITALKGKFNQSGSANKAAELETMRYIDGVGFKGDTNITRYCLCSASDNVAAKTVTVANFSLMIGACIIVRFDNTNKAANPTLNVSGTGAKPIHYQGEAIEAGVLAKDMYYKMVYADNAWNIVGKLGGDAQDVFLTDYASGETYQSTENNGDIMLDVLVPCVGISTNTTLQDIKAIDESKVAEVEWVSHTGGVHSYDCALQLGGAKRVLIATANTQEVVELTIADGKHYGFIVDGANGAFGCSLICFNGTTLKVLKTDGATDEIMDALTNEGGADHDMFVFLPVGTKFTSADGLTEYTKKDNTTVYKERFVL